MCAVLRDRWRLLWRVTTLTLHRQTIVGGGTIKSGVFAKYIEVTVMKLRILLLCVILMLLSLASVPVKAAPITFECKLDSPASELWDCLFAIDVVDLQTQKATTVFRLQPGRSLKFSEEILGRRYCLEYIDKGRIFSTDYDGCHPLTKWVGYYNDNTPETGGKPLLPTQIRFGCQRLSGYCGFLFETDAQSFSLAAGKWIDIEKVSVGNRYCAIGDRHDASGAISFHSCPSRLVSVNRVNDNFGTDFDRRPDTTKQMHLPVADRIGKCILDSSLRMEGKFDSSLDGVPFARLLGPSGDLVSLLAGFYDRSEVDNLKIACQGKWYRETTSGTAKAYLPILDFPWPSSSDIYAFFKLKNVTIWQVVVSLRCNAPAPGMFASRCEAPGPGIDVPKEAVDRAKLAGYTICKTDVNIHKRDGKSGSGWEWSDNLNFFRYWISSESKTFQAGQEVEVTYVHTLVPREHKDLLAIELKCDFAKRGEFGERNGDWRL